MHKTKTLSLLLGPNSNYCANDFLLNHEHMHIMIINLVSPDEKLNKNIDKLGKISALKDNWDGYGAEPFSRSIIRAAGDMLRKLLKQPEIFPTAEGTIQMEYEKENGDYLEIQFSDAPLCEVYMSENQNENYFTIDRTPEKFNELVSNFYGSFF